MSSGDLHLYLDGLRIFLQFCGQFAADPIFLVPTTMAIGLLYGLRVEPRIEKRQLHDLIDEAEA